MESLVLVSPPLQTAVSSSSRTSGAHRRTAVTRGSMVPRARCTAPTIRDDRGLYLAPTTETIGRAPVCARVAAGTWLWTATSRPSVVSGACAEGQAKKNLIRAEKRGDRQALAGVGEGIIYVRAHLPHAPRRAPSVARPSRVRFRRLRVKRIHACSRAVLMRASATVGLSRERGYPPPFCKLPSEGGPAFRRGANATMRRCASAATGYMHLL
jgi:hypothetical protein